MVWRDSFPPANELTLDAEAERERRLAAQARAGADWALTALVARYQPAVTRYLMRLCGDQARARVLAERVFQRMERRLHGPHGADNLRLWLLRASTEAGLDALRRPRRMPAPRLDVTRVAGLLPPQAGAQAQSAIEGGIKRLKRVVGAVSRQARPLIWQGQESAPPASGQSSPRNPDSGQAGPIDESLAALDPQEALRFRLIRLTLADLPYGDAQCLALHLVAGLNQAEVARALGITNSAARRRIVQGLGQFSTRYQTAVRSLGLPDELGYGDALPRVRVEDQPLFAPPDEAPVVVPETPEEPVAEFPQAAPATVPLVVDTVGVAGEPTSGVAFYASSSPEIPVYQPDAEPEFASGPEPYFTEDNQQAFMGAYDDAYAEPYAGPYAESAAGGALEPGSEPYAGQYMEFSDELDETLSPFDEDYPEEFAPGAGADETARYADVENGWSVTRVAADAIVGPVVDALPVDAEPPAPPAGYGGPSARSMPLSYELISGAADPGGITMNWLDADGGMMAPLGFEADATPAAESGGDAPAVAPGGDDDPWAASTVLDLEMARQEGGFQGFPPGAISATDASERELAVPDGRAGATGGADESSDESQVVSVELDSDEPESAAESVGVAFEPDEAPTTPLALDEVPTSLLGVDEVATGHLGIEDIATSRLSIDDTTTSHLGVEDVATNNLSIEEVVTDHLGGGGVATSHIEMDHEATSQFDVTGDQDRAAPRISRTLEDLWDETPDQDGR